MSFAMHSCILCASFNCSPRNCNGVPTDRMYVHSPRHNYCWVRSVQNRPPNLKARRSRIAWWVSVVKGKQMTFKRATKFNRWDEASHMMIPLPLDSASACHLFSSRPGPCKRVATGYTCPKLRYVSLHASTVQHAYCSTF